MHAFQCQLGIRRAIGHRGSFSSETCFAPAAPETPDALGTCLFPQPT